MTSETLLSFARIEDRIIIIPLYLILKTTSVSNVVEFYNRMSVKLGLEMKPEARPDDYHISWCQRYE